MTNVEKYNAIFESLQEKVNNEELTCEQAEELNVAAYNKYVVESKKDDISDMLEELADAVEDGKVTIPKELVDQLKELLPTKEDEDSKDDKEDDSDESTDDTSDEE